MGASPDGVVNCTCCGAGVLEIKCPYKFRDTRLAKAAEDQKFCLDSKLKLKTDHQYYTQVQLQMFVCEAEYADFVVWTLQDCLVVRVMRDNTFITTMVTKLQAIWKGTIAPDLLTRNIEVGQSKDKENEPPKANATVTTYCVCKTTDEQGDMVACD